MSIRLIPKAGRGLTLDEFISFLQGVRNDYGNITVDYCDPEMRGDYGLDIKEGIIFDRSGDAHLRLQ